MPFQLYRVGSLVTRFQLCNRDHLPRSTSRTFICGYPTAASALVRHASTTMSRKIELGRAADYFSIFKRDVIGIYQHCGEKDRQRYLHEFDFRYSNRAALGVDRAHQPAVRSRAREASVIDNLIAGVR